MIRMHSETTTRRRPIPRSETGPFKGRLFEAKANLVTAVLARNSCYVQSDDAPLRYRLLTDTALRLAELNQAAAYFDLSALAYQYDLATWVQNSVRLLSIQLNLQLPIGRWGEDHNNSDPIDYFVQFLEKQVLQRVTRPIMLSFDEADQLVKAPLAANFWRLQHILLEAQLRQSEFQRLTVVMWGETSWQIVAENGRFPSDGFKEIVL